MLNIFLKMRIARISTGLATGIFLLLAGNSYATRNDVPTELTNMNTISNTRHNLTQRGNGGAGGPNSLAPLSDILMDADRNQYYEVCVYCHTPHGSNDAAGIEKAPLWNRTHLGNTYTTYDTLKTSTLTQTVTQPGVNSLTCLSCHDGTLGIDSIVNMPGSGRYGPKTAQNDTFLDVWAPSNPMGATSHSVLGDPATNPRGPGGAQPAAVGCMVCHGGTGTSFATATTFTVFVIGTDLKNDHPIGITYPAARAQPAYVSPAPDPDPIKDFFETTGSSPGLTFYDENLNSRADPNEVRFYDTGDGPEVECASCHDPHGVSQTYPARGLMNPTFLRIKNDGSALCLTCHDK